MSSSHHSASHFNPRILMVSINTPPFVFAGAGHQAVKLSAALIKLGSSVHLVASGAKHQLFEAIHIDSDAESVPATVFKTAANQLGLVVWFNVLSVFWWLGNFAKFDIIHLHGCTHLTTAIWFVLAKLTGKKLLYKPTCDGVDDPKTMTEVPIFGGLAKWLLNNACHAVVAITPTIQQHAQGVIPAEKVMLLPNGIDTKQFLPAGPAVDKAKLRQELGLNKTGPVLLYAGGINPRKNIHELVEVLGRVKASHPEATLCLIGPSKEKYRAYRTKILDRVELLGLKESVVGLDEVPHDQLLQYFQAADVFVFASQQEGLPSAPLEAMACGLPVVMRSIEGVTSWLNETTDCVRVVSSNSVGDFAEVVTGLLNQPEQAKWFGLEARKEIQKRFGLEAVAQTYAEETYPQLLAK